MNFRRLIVHLSTGRAAVRRVFNKSSLDAIERAIHETESLHDGQIRFAVEASLELAPLLAGQTARERAIEVFSSLRVWDTEHNNGVLIYLLLADRDVEIIADRGVGAGNEIWEAICLRMEAEFRAGRFEAGVIAGIREAGEYLAHRFSGQQNEMPDSPVLL